MGMENCRKNRPGHEYSSPKSSLQPDNHRNLQAQISEYHDNDLFKQMATVHIDIQKAKKCWEKSQETEKKERKQEKPLLWPRRQQKSLLMARVIAVMGQTAPEKLLELAVNAVTMYEGKESGARQIKIDFTNCRKDCRKIEEGIWRRRNYVHHLRIRRRKKKGRQKQ